MPLQLNYYYGNEAEQYTFYRIPKILFTDPLFKGVSVEAKVLYGLLLDRMGLRMWKPGKKQKAPFMKEGQKQSRKRRQIRKQNQSRRRNRRKKKQSPRPPREILAPCGFRTLPPAPGRGSLVRCLQCMKTMAQRKGNLL